MSVRKESPKGRGVDVALRELRRAVLRGEQDIHPLVDGVVGDQVVYEALAGLGDPVDAVLRLEVVVEAESAVEEERVVRHGQRQTFLGGSRGSDQNEVG